jgi:hypothetical protein
MECFGNERNRHGWVIFPVKFEQSHAYFDAPIKWQSPAPEEQGLGIEIRYWMVNLAAAAALCE